jgi:2-keto-4-pentenoate hydratase/2-oxohepta-3-ene-1,7-dioic acid hydratase in catechol pathway
MKIGTFLTANGITYGFVMGNDWLDMRKTAQLLNEPPAPETLAEFVAAGDEAIDFGNRLQRKAFLNPETVKEARHSLETSEFLPPFYPGGRLFTQRGNSCLFSRRTQRMQPEHPIWERRFSTNLIGHNQTCTFLGGACNPEFIAVIGKGGRDITRNKIREHIFGYTMMMDHPGFSHPVFDDDWGMGTYRDEFIFRDHMFCDSYYGNSLPSTPVGPWIVTKDVIADPYSLWISAEEHIDGIRLVEMVSSGASAFRFEDTLSFMSRIMTLKPGDMLSTSSIGYDGYPFWDDMPPGSWFQTTCEKIGSLRMYLKAKA